MALDIQAVLQNLVACLIVCCLGSCLLKANLIHAFSSNNINKRDPNFLVDHIKESKTVE